MFEEITVGIMQQNWRPKYLDELFLVHSTRYSFYLSATTHERFLSTCEIYLDAKR